MGRTVAPGRAERQRLTRRLGDSATRRLGDSATRRLGCNPALVFEVGLDDSLDTWLPMMRTMSEFTTAIAYSRAGFGRSEWGSSDHSVPAAARDLHELRHTPGVAPPYILVARSYGDIIARLFPIAVLTSMKSDESAPYVNGTARASRVARTA